MNSEAGEVFLGVMDLQEAKTHQLRLKQEGVKLNFKASEATCRSGCKVTVEVWGIEADADRLRAYFSQEFQKNVKGHEPNLEYLSAVFDPNAAEVVCQACGTGFSPKLSECPDCGLVYSV